MIPTEFLQRKSLFSLLFNIDLELAEQTRAKRCPFAGVHCTAPIISENLGADLLILLRVLKSALVCAVAVRAAGDVCCLHLYVFGGAGFTGRLCCYWSVLFAKGKNLLLLWSGSRRFAGYGVLLSSVGNATFKTFLLKASDTVVCPDT